MHTAQSHENSLAKGVVGCNVSFIAIPFTSEEIRFFDSSATDYSVTAISRQAGERVVYITLDKNITPGSYDLKTDPQVFAYYYHKHESFGWIYRPEAGTLQLNSVDFEKFEIDATFEFTAINTPDKQPVAITNGVLILTGPDA
ncbi:hypothetical protein YA0871_26155 [Pseudomonas paralactis]|uniref:Uncharacterized protein n=1 Tax=Pseudomonas paralactis TaxID=1615673 RepID=A0ABS0V770_9PSED|nr:DUF6252 family protein [Pseudomonas paralactis]MBI6636137.1 hypothetical protein [Pseudomonas paralactis]